MPLDAKGVGKVHRRFPSLYGCGAPLQGQCIHIPQRFPGEAFSSPAVSNTLRGHLFRARFSGAWGWPVCKEAGPRYRTWIRGMNPPKHREMQETRGEKEYSVIRADLPLGYSQREGEGPLGWARFSPARAAFLPAIAAVAAVATVTAAPAAVAAASAATTAASAAVITAPAAALRLRTRFVNH